MQNIFLPMGILLAGLMFLPQRTEAGIFTWSAPAQVATAERTLDLPGTIVGAEVFGVLPAVVILPDNTTIEFKTDGSVATAINTIAPMGSGTSDGAYAGTTGNSDLDTVLNQYSYDGGAKTITLYNLQVGNSYSVQLFALDDRTNASQIARLTSFQDPNDPNNVSPGFKMGGNYYMLGKFTAPDAGDGSKTVNVVLRQNLPDSGNGNLNALVIRDLGAGRLPRIMSQPRAITAYAGGRAHFLVVATARAPACQWQMKAKGSEGFSNLKDGSGISGSRTPQLWLSNLRTDDSGEYRVVLTSDGVPLTSRPATLTVLPQPALPEAGSYAAVVLASHPLAYWRLNETESNHPFYDFAGGYQLLNHGVIPGRPGLRAPAFPGFSPTNGAAFFDGQNSGAASGASLLSERTNFTVMGWFNPAGRQNGSRVGLFGQNDVFELGYNDSQGINLFMQMSASKEWFFLDTGTNGFTPGNWYFVAVRADGTNLDIYVNGAPRMHQGNCGSSIGSSTYGFNVGGDGVLDPSGNCFYGSIEDVAVFDRALPPDLIQRLYRAAAGLVAPAITVKAQSQARYLGAWVRFDVMAEGCMPLQYQWQVWTGDHGGFTNLKDAGGYSGVKTPNLVITNLTLSEVGKYRVVVANPAGSTNSAVVTLTALSGTPEYIWSGPIPITTAEATLSLPGTVVGAEVFGTMAKTMILTNNTVINFQTNGVVATVTNGSPIWGGAGTGTGAFLGTTGNPDLDAVLSQFDHDGGPKLITLHRLIVGHRYSVQLFALDDRIGIPGTRQVNFQSAGDALNQSASYSMADNAYMLATFTAAREEAVIQENLPTGKAGNLNALVLRDLGAGSPP